MNDRSHEHDYSYQIDNEVNSQSDINTSRTNLLNKQKTRYETSIDESGKFKLFFIIMFTSIVIVLAILCILYQVIVNQTNAYLYELGTKLEIELNKKDMITTTLSK